MILSHDFQFIFVKTRKTGGTSVEISLSRYAGPLDIVTPISYYDEYTRAKMGVVPQNFSTIEGATLPHQDVCDEEEAISFLKDNAEKTYIRGNFTNHMTCNDIKLLTGEKLFLRYYKFCIERNPFDRAISLYHHLSGPKRYGCISQFIEARPPKMNSDQYMINGVLAVDRVICYERMADEIPEVTGLLGMDFDGWLPNAKGHFRTDKRPWKEALSPKEIDRIAHVFAPDIAAYEALFGRIEIP